MHATRFIYNNNNNNNKQGIFTPNGINNELEEFTKESSRKSSRSKIWLGFCEGEVGLIRFDMVFEGKVGRFVW